MRKITVDKRAGFEVWAAFDRSAQVWELFTEQEAECYIGCADTIPEAHKVAANWIAEQGQ